jgi:hypothetical protein
MRTRIHNTGTECTISIEITIIRYIVLVLLEFIYLFDLSAVGELTTHYFTPICWVWECVVL